MCLSFRVLFTLGGTLAQTCTLPEIGKEAFINYIFRFFERQRVETGFCSVLYIFCQNVSKSHV